MKITLSPIFSGYSKNNNTAPYIQYHNLAPLKYDTVSFGAMKKREFSGIDLAVIEKFKAPTEKFNSNEDLQIWAKNRALEISKKDFKGRQKETIIQRKATIQEWSDYVLNKNNNYTGTMALLILNAVTKDLKSDNDEIPPILNKRILANCIEETDTITKKNPKYQFDFNKMYKCKLQSLYFKDSTTDKGIFNTKWIVIPSKDNDPHNFDKNVEKLKVLSNKTWCTKSFKAEPYLAQGDFHIYIENGKPKIGIRFIDNKIEEIQGEKNNGKIPIAYMEEIENHITNNNLVLNNNANKQFKIAKKAKPAINKIKTDLKNAIETNNTKAIYKYFKIKVLEDPNGDLTISKYKQPSVYYSFDDIGIDENKLFENVKAITGEANFKDSTLTELKNLQYIGKDAYFTNSNITNLGSLKTIGGNALFANSQVDNLGCLELIEGDVDFMNSPITSLCNLQHITGDAFFGHSKITNLNKLKSIKGDIYIANSLLKPSDFDGILIGKQIKK